VAQSKYDHKLSNIPACNGGIGSWPKASMIISLVKLSDAKVELALVTQSKHGHKFGKNCRMLRWNWLVAQSKYDDKLSSIAGCKGGNGSWPKASMIISLVVLPDGMVELARSPRQA